MSLGVWTSTQTTTPKIITSDLYCKLFTTFKDDGIEIPFPQSDLQFQSVLQTVPALTISARGGTEVKRVPDAFAMG